MVARFPHVVLHGVFPPPWGGVSVHLQRLEKFLLEQGVAVRRVDMKRGPMDRWPGYRHWILPALQLVPTWRALLHHHVSSFTDLEGSLWLRPMGRGPLLATLHNTRMLDPWMESSTTSHANGDQGKNLKRLDAVLVVNERMRDPLHRLGVKDERIHHVPAFLPPQRNPDARAHLMQRFPFLATGTPVVTTTASSAEEYQGVPLYGWDMMLQLAARLVSSHPGIQVLFVQTKPGDAAWQRRFHEERRRLGVESCFHLSEEPCDFPELMSMSNVFVRPTNTDGDALSVREALFLGIPVVASDCAPRPEGTRLFRNRDLGSLVEVVDFALRGGPPPMAPDLRDYGQDVLRLYHTLGLTAKR